MLTSTDPNAELEAYRKLKPLDPWTDPKYQVDNSNWVFDLQPATPQMVAQFKRNCGALASAMPDDPTFYVTTMWATPLMLMPAMFGAQWEQTLAAGSIPTGGTLVQRRPGAVHFADVVLLRIMRRALEKSGLEMNVVSDPMLALDVTPGAQTNRPKKLSACANEECMRLDVQILKCSKCKVAYYCNATCQRADWQAGHKAECKQLQEAHDKLPWKKQFDKDYAKLKAAKQSGNVA